MILRFKTASLLFVAVVFIGTLGVIFTPHFAAAVAGSGGGGGQTGCSKASYSTCYGAVWRYYKTTQDPYPITNVGGVGTTRVTGCSATGGFFAYVLVNKNGGSGVRSWKIGPGQFLMDKSMFFGGWTYYRVASNPSDPLPTNPSDGDYSWYSVEKAFNLTKSLGQNSNYEWNGDSALGWFCYSGIDFTLTPSISVNPSAAVTAGGTVAALAVVKNAGPTQSSNTNWQISQFTVVPGGSIPSGGDSPKDPRTFFGAGTSMVDSSSGQFPVGTTNFTQRLVTVPDLPVGTKICFALSVNPFNQTTSNWRHSTPACVVIAKRPITQIIGGDLRVGAAFIGSTAPVAGSNIQTSITIKTGKSYGTWGEYGLIASGVITGAASGSAYSGGLACTTGCATNNISFTNSSGTIGKYTVATNIPDVASSFSVSASTPQFSSLADAASKRVETSNNDITITGGTIQKGQWLVINAPTKTVTITGDITYANTALSSIADIPQLVIIANQINIEGNVKNIDAWLIASGAIGSINTCTQSGATAITTTTRLTINLCNNPLVINGPLMARKVYLRRTAGAGAKTESDNPAEVINLRPDAYLWGVYQASQSARLDTTATQELPPRF